MNIHQLQYFCVLAETEHYTRAAEILSITQPSLTHSIKELEKELNVSLFNKEGRNVKINRYGKFLYKNVNQILNELNTTKSEIQTMIDPGKGTINLAFLNSLSQEFIPKVICSFMNIEENKNISFIFDQATTSSIIEGFNSNTIDIAFTSKIDQENIVSIPILKQELFLITPLDHPLADKDEIDLLEAAEYPFIFYKERSGLRPVINDLFKHINIEPNISFQLCDDAAICGFVAANLGVAIVPRIFGLDRYPVKVIKLKSPNYERFIYLSYSQDKFISPPVSKFKSFILNDFIKRLTESAN